MSATQEIEISHQPDDKRFVVDIDGSQGHLEYELSGTVMDITHTIVPPEIGGRGIASALVRAAAEHARAAGLSIVPTCSYAKVWFDRHAEYADLLA